MHAQFGEAMPICHNEKKIEQNYVVSIREEAFEDRNRTLVQS
jgi:hypothetical protein